MSEDSYQETTQEEFVTVPDGAEADVSTDVGDVVEDPLGAGGVTGEGAPDREPEATEDEPVAVEPEPEADGAVASDAAESPGVDAEAERTPVSEPAEGASVDVIGHIPTDAPPAEASVSDAPVTTTRRGSRSRRATRPAAAPEPLDVFAELGVAREQVAETGVAGVTPAPSALDRIVFESPDRLRAEFVLEDEPDADDVDAEPADAEPDAEADVDNGPRLPATALLFQAPDPAAARPRRRRAQAPTGAPSGELRFGPAATESADGESRSVSRAATDEGASAEETLEPLESDDGAAEEVDETQDVSGEGPAGGSAGGARRRRRRGGRGRRRPAAGESGEPDDDGPEPSDGEDVEEGAAAENGDDLGETGESDEAETAEENGDEGSGGSSRRRRRRRRGTRSGEIEEPTTSVRESRTDEVTALKGSTRLEAKRQRRREGRDAGRRRTIVTEAEFLARRESVDRAMVVRERGGRTQIAVLEDGVLVEHFVARKTQTSLVGSVYLGRVQNVLPSMEAAFVDLGKGRNAVLYAGEVNWDAAGMEGQPRRIEQALSAGDSVLVQVTKDPIGHKGARLTSQITLAGRYLVLVPSGAMTGISRKLPDTERARLKRLLKEIVPESAGVIVRTAAEGASEEELRLDVARLQAQWAEIEKKSKTASAPSVLSSEPDLAIRVVRDVFNEDFGSVTVAGDEAWETISGYVSSVAPDLAPRLHRWTSERDVFAAHRIDEQLAKGMDRKVWLPSGGSLVIDRTEAMTVVDVNTGKFTGTGGTLEETVTRNNLEAAEEIVRQLRLRDIGGIIVIDFIDMVLESNRDLVLRRLVECLGRDRTRHQVAEVTSLGLVQMTRKRVGQGLFEAFSETCDCCNGRGYIVHTDPVEKPSNGGNDAPQDDASRPGTTGTRRRGRRGAESPAPAVQGANRAAATRPAGDADTLAARESVKATLATIAAAAAHAHEEHDVPVDGQHGEVFEVTHGEASVPVDEPSEVEVIDFDAIRGADDGGPLTVPAEPDVEEEPVEAGAAGAASGVHLDEAAVETLDFDVIAAAAGGASATDTTVATDAGAPEADSEGSDTADDAPES